MDAWMDPFFEAEKGRVRGVAFGLGHSTKVLRMPASDEPEMEDKVHLLWVLGVYIPGKLGRNDVYSARYCDLDLVTKRLGDALHSLVHGSLDRVNWRPTHHVAHVHFRQQHGSSIAVNSLQQIGDVVGCRQPYGAHLGFRGSPKSVHCRPRMHTRCSTRA
jgi:hypothetical protein